MKKIIFVTLVVSMVFFSAAFSQEAVTVVNSNNQFALKLYSRYKSKEGNIFYSPYSITSCLAMTFEGARGNTADEMQALFNFPKTDTVRRQGFLKINERINQKDESCALKVANALWAEQDYKFLDSYFGLISQYYSGNATNMDFKHNAEQSRLTINSWVEKQTNDRIKDLIPSGVIDPFTRLVLTNAVYFKGTWVTQFDEKHTKDEDFRTALGNTKVKMMNLAGESFYYAETNDLQVLELPYKGKSGLSMLILLPKNDDLKTMEDNLTSGKLSELRKSLKPERVDVSMPKFKFETKYFMAADLKEIGMHDAFTLGIDFGGKADFSGMTGNKQLNISDVIHQAFVEVNELGTEAAAATAVVMKVGCAMPSEPPEIKIFKADHPFIFVIQERDTGNILFMGRVSDPLAG